MSITSGDPVGGRRASGPILLISQYPEVIHSHVLGVVVIESELPDGTWRDVLSSLDDVPDPALLIVVSRLAGERVGRRIEPVRIRCVGEAICSRRSDPCNRPRA